MQLEKISTSIVTAPTSILPVSLAQIKTHLRLPSDLTDEDSVLITYIETAEKMLEDITNIRLRESTLIDKYGYRSIAISKRNKYPNYSNYTNLYFTNHPVTQLVSVEFYDLNDDLQELDSALYNLREVNNSYFLEIDESTNVLTLSELQSRFTNLHVTYKVGAVNSVASQFILLMVGQWYKNRELFGSYPTKYSDTVILNSLLSSLRN